MNNPFKFGTVVREDAFCNRKQEARDLRRSIDDAGRIFLYAERRMGKTSLVRRVLDELPDDEYVAAYVDLFPTESAASFTAALAKAIAEATSTKADRLLNTAQQFFSGLRPAVTFDDAGRPVLVFGAGMPTGSEPELDEVLQAPAHIAKDGRRVVIVFDEFQQITTYGDQTVERKLRATTQHQEDVAYIFMGSRKHLIQEMFLDTKRPLYRSAEHYPLLPIELESWKPFVSERFLAAGKQMPDERISDVYALTGGHPFYMQHLCHVLWERCGDGETIGEASVEEAVEVLLDRESYAYTSLWESLAQNQRLLLRALAREPDGMQPYSSGFLQRSRLASPSTVQRAAEALIQRDLIDRENGSFRILDRFFSLWIRRL